MYQTDTLWEFGKEVWNNKLVQMVGGGGGGRFLADTKSYTSCSANNKLAGSYCYFVVI